ncbi:MAG: peptidoglycan-binding protein [Methanobrevibacter sp.]|nr:peptidoglycan-binding protein [Methanobrevibacter sp.]
MIERTANNLVSFCKSVLGCGYFYGCFGQMASESLYQYKKHQYPEYYEWSYESYKKYFGTRVCDCAGLLKWFLWSDNMTNKNPTYNSKEDYGATGFYNNCCTIKGTLSKNNINEMLPGYIFFKGNGTIKNHMGIYIGNNTIIEAKGHNYGIVSSPYGSTWEYYGKCDLIKYDGVNPGNMCNVETHEVQKGDTCYSVGVLQTLLNDLGYKGSDNKKLTVDCIFGGNTDKACKDFQKDNKLVVDGICGSKTWGKLLNG